MLKQAQVSHKKPPFQHNVCARNVVSLNLKMLLRLWFPVSDFARQAVPFSAMLLRVLEATLPLRLEEQPVLGGKRKKKDIVLEKKRKKTKKNKHHASLVLGPSHCKRF